MARKKSAKAEREQLAKQTSNHQHRAALHKRKTALDTAKRSKREDLGKAQATCKTDRENTYHSTRTAYQAVVEKARAKRDNERAGARTRCALGKRAVEEKHGPAIKTAAQALKDERDYQKREREIAAGRKHLDRDNKQRRPRKNQGLRARDEEVIQNLPPELVPVWHSIKRVIRSSPTRSRLEAFQDYIHDNPHIVTEVHERIAEQEVKKLEREAARAYAEERFMPRKTREPRDLESEADEGIGAVVDGALDEVLGFFDSLANGSEEQAA